MPQRKSVGHFRDQDMTENKWSDSQLKKLIFFLGGSAVMLMKVFH